MERSRFSGPVVSGLVLYIRGAVSDPQNEHAPASRRRLRWAGLALAMLVLLTVLGIGAVLGGLPQKLAGRDGAHSTAASSSGQINLPRGFVLMSVGGPVFHAATSITRGDYADIAATVDSRHFSPVNRRSVTRTVFTSVSVYEVDPAAAGSPKIWRLVVSLCDADYMSWFLQNATVVTATPAGAHASQPESADFCFNHMGVSNLAVDARWHFSSAPADG
jgi:hypothetical protein